MTFKTVKNICIGILALNFVVIFHELGHFLACKAFHVPVHTFSVGFPPVLASVKVGDTSYQLGALPLGGYVQPDIEAVNHLPYVPKMIIVLAGIFMNLLLSFLIFFGLARRANSKPIAVIDQIRPDSPAQHAQLRVNDRFIAVNDQLIDQENVSSFLQHIMSSAGKHLKFTIERDNQRQDITVAIDKSHPLYGEGFGMLGADLKTVATEKPSLWQAITHSRTAFSSLFTNMGPAVSALINPRNQNKATLVGPIGMMSVLGKSLGYSYQTFLYFIALVSFNICIFNLLPIPMLDGEKAAQYTIQAIIGPHATPQIGTVLYYLILAVMVAIMIRLSIKDVRNLSSNK